MCLFRSLKCLSAKSTPTSHQDQPKALHAVEHDMDKLQSTPATVHFKSFWFLFHYDL